MTKQLTMSITFRCPYENTTAFGGVATGNMNENEVAMAVGNIMYNGLTCNGKACKETRKNVLINVNPCFHVNCDTNTKICFN